MFAFRLRRDNLECDRLYSSARRHPEIMTGNEASSSAKADDLVTRASAWEKFDCRHVLDTPLSRSMTSPCCRATRSHETHPTLNRIRVPDDR